jgi:uncharacterized protein YndB with AHSA1/START domain
MNQVTKIEAGVLTITRTFDAPRALVFKCFTDPSMAVMWHGPVWHPASSYKADVRVGGTWRACLRGTEGRGDLWHGGTYQEVKAPERLVYTFKWDNHPLQVADTLVTVTFVEKDGKTVMTMQQTGFDSAASGEGHGEGWNSVYDRLGDYLARLQA